MVVFSTVTSCFTHILALGDGGEIDLNLGLGQNIGRSRHVDEEICRTQPLACIASIAAQIQSIRYTANGYPEVSNARVDFVPTLSGAPSWCGVEIPCTVAFAPKLASAPIVPTMKYWMSFGPSSPPLESLL